MPLPFKVSCEVPEEMPSILSVANKNPFNNPFFKKPEGSSDNKRSLKAASAAGMNPQAYFLLKYPSLRFFYLLENNYSCEFGSGKYYAYCGFGGILSCGLTHTAVVPIDLVKCRIQVCWRILVHPR